MLSFHSCPALEKTLKYLIYTDARTGCDQNREDSTKPESGYPVSPSTHCVQRTQKGTAPQHIQGKFLLI